MEKTNFKTNINCSGCVEKVKPFLDNTVGEKGWTVDTQNPAKILSVDSSVKESEVITAVQRAGFRIEKA